MFALYFYYMELIMIIMGITIISLAITVCKHARLIELNCALGMRCIKVSMNHVFFEYRSIRSAAKRCIPNPRIRIVGSAKELKTRIELFRAFVLSPVIDYREGLPERISVDAVENTGHIFRGKSDVTIRGKLKKFHLFFFHMCIRVKLTRSHAICSTRVTRDRENNLCRV